MKKGLALTFPAEGVHFLRSLKRNNNRDWFNEHKAVYEQFVKRPMTDLIANLANDFQDFAPEMVATPKTSAYRIYRDTRFSRDKSPFKTHVAAVFPRSGLGKHEGAGFYFHISSSEVLVGGGIYMPSPKDLSAVRQRIADEHRAFVKIITSPRFRNIFGTLEGKRLNRTPRGFSSDHPAAEYLKYKQFLAARTAPSFLVSTQAFYPFLIETFSALVPLVRFLNEPLILTRRRRNRQNSLLEVH